MASPRARASPSAFQTLPFLIDVKLDRTSAPLSERSVVMVISPLVSLSEAIFKVLVCLFDVQCHSLWKEVLFVTFAENWSQSKYVVSGPRTVWPECVYNPRDLCVSDPRDLLLECVLMDSAFNGKSIRLEKHLQCEKLLGLARGTTKKRGNKKSDESITPIRYNVNHAHVYW